MLTGALILAVGLGCGWLVGLAWARQMAGRPVCVCGHGFGHHGELACQGEVRVLNNRRDSMRRCGCRTYTGPDPALVEQSLDRTMQRYGNLFARLKGRDESD
jgi:hypothetical protein